jgi:predicted enzyme related to lactoylglutathione lyase
MSITQSFAGVAVADYETMRAWYERLLGREPDMVPHDAEACWQLTDGGWLYVVADRERAGGSLITLMVDDLDAALAAIEERGIAHGDVETMPGKARTAEVVDPEGNVVKFGQPLS